MNSSEMRLLASHMGHDLNIHVDHYTMQSNLLERAKVARVLSAVNNGHLHKLDSVTDLELVEVLDTDMMEDTGNVPLLFLHFLTLMNNIYYY